MIATVDIREIFVLTTTFSLVSLHHRLRDGYDTAVTSLQANLTPIQARDICAYGSYCLLQLKQIGSVDIIAPGGLDDQLVRVASDLDIDTSTLVNQPVLQGWARRPAKGKMYGAKYIREFESDIRELYERGAENKSEKLGAGRMLEELTKKYPHRYALPSESEIRTEISRLFSQSKKRKRVNTDFDDAIRLGERQGKTRKRMNQNAVSFIQGLLEREPNLSASTIV